MSVIVAIRPEPAQVPHRFTVDEFHLMGEVGLFDGEKRYELLEGEIIEMLPPGPFHGSHVDRVNAKLIRQLPERYHPRCQGNVRLSDLSEPLPDFAIFRPHPDEYTSRLPMAKDVLLLIEVADSSLTHDRERKARIYARAGVPEYWIVDVRGRQVLVFRKPRRTGYGEMKAHAPGDKLRSVKVAELDLKVDDLLVKPR